MSDIHKVNTLLYDNYMNVMMFECSFNKFNETIMKSDNN